MDDYWEDRCPKCLHARKWHGEGGCNAPARYMEKCGCLVRQVNIPRKEN